MEENNEPVLMTQIFGILSMAYKQSMEGTNVEVVEP